jgi:hypothetical protein
VSEQDDTTPAPEPLDQRPDPRLRPPDPAGTQPKWDPDDLLPKATPRAAAGRLWSEAEDAPGTETVRPSAAAVAGIGAPVGATTTAEPRAAEADGYPPHSARFQFLLGALLAVGIAAVALLVAVLVSNHDDTKTIVLRPGLQWSRWEPSATTATDAATEIADHVGHEYHLANGKQLVGVSGGPLQIEDLPGTIVIQHPASQGGDTDILRDGASMMYSMIGVGPADGTIPGTPSMSRALLVRREALELALYTFRYVAVSETVVMLPPSFTSAGGKATKTKAAPTALLFRRDDPDIQMALARPLRDTLTGPAPTIHAIRESNDAGTIHALTDSKAYSFSWQPSNTDVRAFLVLQPTPFTR